MLNPAERNYQIYDQELLAIVRSLEAWRHYVDSNALPIRILTNHKNLTYFCMPQHLNRRQARWQLFLSEFNLELEHRPGIHMT